MMESAAIVIAKEHKFLRDIIPPFDVGVVHCLDATQAIVTLKFFLRLKVAQR